MSTNPDLTYNLDGSLDMRCKKNKEWIAKQNKKINKQSKKKPFKKANTCMNTSHISDQPLSLDQIYKQQEEEANKHLLLPGGQSVYFMK